LTLTELWNKIQHLRPDGVGFGLGLSNNGHYKF